MGRTVPIPGAGDGRETSSLDFDRPVKPWHDDRIKLQAVAWGANPDECMAIINDRLVHQGSVVDGFTVASIDEKAVILTREGDRWRLFLGP